MKISVGQFAPSENKAENLDSIRALATQARDDGSRVLITPEASLFRPKTAGTLAVVDAAEHFDGPFVQTLKEFSSEYGLLIASGSYRPAEGAPGHSDSPAKVYNTQVIVDQGQLVASYDKLHLYDAFAYRESDYIVAGDSLPPVLEIEGVKIGFSTCYDLRFPELFRTFADRSVDVMAIGAAWARGILKEDHWMTLLRARAIENTAYVFASGEVGPRSIGRSAILDPLGVQLAEGGDMNPVVLTEEVSQDRIRRVREMLPSLLHRKTLAYT
jgi:predicted amidohydrolase